MRGGPAGLPLFFLPPGKFFDKDNKPVLVWMRASDAEGNVLRQYV